MRFVDDDEDDRELDDDERALADRLRELPDERLDAERLPDPLLDERLRDEPLERLDPLDFDLPDPPLLRRSAILWSPSRSRSVVTDSYPWTGTIPPRSGR